MTVLRAQDLGLLRELLARSDPEVVIPCNSTPPLSQTVILTLVHRLATAIGEAPLVDESFRSALWWLQRVVLALDPYDPIISPYVSRVFASTHEILKSTKQRVMDLPGGPQAARTITDLQEMLFQYWDVTYLTVLYTQDLGQLRELLARSTPEVVMPLLSTPPLSQAVILTLLHRLAAAIDEAPSLEENFRGGLRWLRRAALALNPHDPTISPYIPRVLPSTQRTLDSAKEQLMALPGGQTVDAVRIIADVQGILNGKA